MPLSFSKLTYAAGCLLGLGACDWTPDGAPSLALSQHTDKGGDTLKLANETVTHRSDTRFSWGDTTRKAGDTLGAFLSGDLPRLQPGPLAPELPEMLGGLVNPVAMERLSIDPYGPALAGDLVTLDLAGPTAHLTHRTLPLTLIRHRERSDGSWMPIDRSVLGQVRGELHHAIALLSEAERRSSIESAPVGFVATVVVDEASDAELVRVVPLGRNRVGGPSDVFRIPTGLAVEALRIDTRGSVRLVLVDPGAGTRQVITTERDAETRVFPLDGRIDTTRWALAWTTGAAPICAGFACVGATDTIEAVGVARAMDLPASDRRVCGVGDTGLVVATLATTTALPNAPSPRCAALPASTAMDRCASTGGRLDIRAAVTGWNDVAERGELLSVTCTGPDGEADSATFTRGIESDAAWLRLIETDTRQHAEVTGVTLDDGCHALRVAANDSRTGPVLVDVPLGDCGNDTTLAMRALPRAMADSAGGAIALRADGLVPARALVHDLRAPGKASCELGGEGEATPLCADTMTGGTRVLRDARTFPASSGGTWVVATFSGALERDGSANAGIDSPLVRMSAPSAALLRLDRAGQLIGRSGALPTDCAPSAVIGDRAIAACQDGVRAFDLKLGARGDSAIDVVAAARWPVDSLKAPGQPAMLACGENPSRDAESCPTLTTDASSPGIVYAHTFDATRGRERLHAMTFAPADTADGASLVYQTTALPVPMTSADHDTGTMPMARDVLTTVIDGRLLVVLTVSEGPESQHDIQETILVRLAFNNDGAAKTDIMRRRAIPSDGASRVTPVGIATVGFDHDGAPRRVLVGVVTDHSASLPDPETGARRVGPANLDTVAITSLDHRDSHAEPACRWTIPGGASPFAPLVRTVGAGLPAAAVLGRSMRLVDVNGDGLTDVLVDVAADDAVAMSARHTQVLVADGRGAFNAARSAAPELWSMPDAIGHHGTCALPVLTNGDGLALFGADAASIAECSKRTNDADM